MNIENFICDYLAIPNKFERGFGLSLEFAKIDPIAARAKYEYSGELAFLIKRFIRYENLDSATLKYLIDSYGVKLLSNFPISFILYKKYLLIKFKDEKYYKSLFDLISEHWSNGWTDKVKLMYDYVHEKNFKAAREILKTLSD